MTFLPPRGATLVHLLGAGTVMDVALVRWGDTECICKRLRSRMTREPAAQRALRREAAVLELVRHPALPELVAQGDDSAGPYLVETCLRGASLRELVEGWRERGGRMPPELQRHVLRQSARTFAELHGLTAARALGLVHGDIAPDHLMLGEDGRMLVVDWGQASFAGMDPSLQGDDRGTLPFVAPELARGEVKPSQRTDLYALAATLAYVVLGREPCQAEPGAGLLVEVAERGVDCEAIAASADVPATVRDALLAALRFEPEARVQSAAEFAILLAR